MDDDAARRLEYPVESEPVPWHASVDSLMQDEPAVRAVGHVDKPAPANALAPPGERTSRGKRGGRRFRARMSRMLRRAHHQPPDEDLPADQPPHAVDADLAHRYLIAWICRAARAHFTRS